MADTTESSDEDTLYPYDDFDDEVDDCLGKRMPPNAPKICCEAVWHYLI